MLLRYLSKHVKLGVILLGLGIFSGGLLAQGYTPIFVSTDVHEWDIDGRVSDDMVDTTLSFVFSFDGEHPPLDRPDTVYLDLNNTIDLSGCDSVFIRYSSADELPSDESWVAGDVQVLVRHPYNPNWTEIYDEDLSHLGGWVHHLELRLKVAVRSNPAAPGSFVLHNIRFEGICSP